MIFLLNLLFSSIYCFLVDKCRLVAFNKNIYFSFVILIWTIFVGSQYGVGTDYFTYLDIFTNSNSLLHYKEYTNEFAFYYIVYFFQSIGGSGIFIFYVFALINSILFFIVLDRLKIENSFLFVFLYISFSTLFHAQFNVLRQASAVFLITLAFVYKVKGQYLKSVLLYVLSFGFHNSLLFLFPCFWLIRCYTKKTVLFLLLCSILVSMIPLKGVVSNILHVIPMYSHYIDRESFEYLPWSMKISKYLMIPIYVSSLFFCNVYSLDKFQQRMYFFGFLSFAFRIAFLSLSLASRFSFVFLLTSLYPIYIYLDFLYRRGRKCEFVLWISYILIFYMLKVILLPTDEYKYSSVWMNII